MSRLAPRVGAHRSKAAANDCTKAQLLVARPYNKACRQLAASPVACKLLRRFVTYGTSWHESRDSHSSNGRTNPAIGIRPKVRLRCEARQLRLKCRAAAIKMIRAVGLAIKGCTRVVTSKPLASSTRHVSCLGASSGPGHVSAWRFALANAGQLACKLLRRFARSWHESPTGLRHDTDHWTRYQWRQRLADHSRQNDR